MKHRKGYTLVEMLAVIAVASTIAGMAVTALHTVLEAEASARQRLQNRTAVSLLARQFRSDAHAAIRLSPIGPDGKSEWQFDGGQDHRIRYTLADQQLLRTETVAGEVRSRETFPLPEATTAVLELVSPETSLATLRILPGAAAAAGQKPIRIDACLGMDHRFEKVAGTLRVPSAEPAEVTP